MFNIDPATSAVTMHRGDTGSFWVQLHRGNGRPFSEGDVALFTVKDSEKRTMMEREYPLDDNEGAGNGRFLVAFRNSDTDTWEAGLYSTEVKAVISPIRLDGEVKDGSVVRTLVQSTITIMDVLREV